MLIMKKLGKRVLSVRGLFYSAVLLVFGALILLAIVNLSAKYLPANRLTHFCVPADIPSVEPLREQDLDSRDLCYEQNRELLGYTGIYPYAPELKPSIVSTAYNLFIATVMISASLIMPTGAVMLYRGFKELQKGDGV
jgi:hypothetical protein